MLLKLLALFTIIPLVELALLIPLGMQIGVWPTIGLVVATALLGAFLAKHEGARALASIKSELAEGKLPADSILDGLAILIAGVFLVTPGVLTDVVAIFLLIPVARAPVRAIARKRFEKMLETESMTFISGGAFGESSFESPGSGEASPFQGPFGPGADQGEIIDVTPDEEESRQTTSAGGDDDQDQISSW